MDTILIQSILSADPVLKKCFIGVFAADKLPKKANHLPIGSIIISNTQPSSHPGEHWILFQIKDIKTIIYFDTSGREFYINKYFRNFLKNHCEYVEFNKFQIQAEFTNTCGLYVCILALHLAHGCSFQHFLNYFSMHNLLRNDFFITKMFFKNFEPKHLGLVQCSGSLCVQKCKPLKRHINRGRVI